jgi:hypothetical protein
LNAKADGYDKSISAASYRVGYLKVYSALGNSPCDFSFSCEPLVFSRLQWLELDNIEVKEQANRSKQRKVEFTILAMILK